MNASRKRNFYISPSAKKPVYFKSLNNTFIRRGSSDQRATRTEIDAMFRDQSFGTKTGELAPGTSRSDLKEKSIREYKTYLSNFNPEVSYNRMELDELLVKLRVLDKETGQCTFGALLFFGQRDSAERFFADFRIDLLEVPGTAYENAPTRYTFHLSEDDYENLWEAYFECIKRLRKEVDVEFKLAAEGFGEEHSPGLKAAREALVNMLMHADYFSPAHARIRIYTNHIEYYNPGGLPKPLEEHKGRDLSIPRNPVIAKLFRMVKMAENAGYGLDKMEENWKAYNHTAPVFDTAFDSTIVKLFTTPKEDSDVEKDVGENREPFQSLKFQLSDNPDENLNLLHLNYTAFTGFLQENLGITSGTLRRFFGDKPALLLFLIAIDSKISANEASKFMGVSSRTVETYIAKLKEQGILERVGPDYSGEWVIKSTE